MSHKMTVSPSDDGRRLDKVIRSIWPGLPLSVVMKSIRTGSVRLDGKKAPFDARVAAGQELYVPWESPREAAGEYRYRRSLPVIYRGEGIWAVDKPVNLLVQPDRQGQDNVLDRVKYMLGLEGLEERAYAVHRLDRNTTGILLVALSGVELRILQDAFRERAIGKKYLAVVAGLPAPAGEINAPLLKDPSSNTVRVDRGGKEALTRYRLIAGEKDISLVEIELITGRSHQARVHMASAGHPVLGDVRYGAGEVNARWRKSGVCRPLLHSWKLAFGSLAGRLEALAGKTLAAPPAEDMASIIAARGWPLPRE